MAIASAVLIAIYIVSIVAVVMWPTRRHHPEDPMAIGGLMFIVMVLVLLGVALAIGVWFEVRAVVYVIFVMTVLPAVLLAPQLAWQGIKTLRRRAAARGTRIPPDQLVKRLSGQTHVNHYGSKDPPRNWKEMRYYSPDGRVIQYEEEGGRTRLIPGNVTWAIEGGLLVTLNDIQPGNKNRYLLRETPDGQIGYHIHAPFSRIHGLLSRRTVAMQAGEPVATETAAG